MFYRKTWTLKWVSKFFFPSTDSNYGLATCQWRLEINNYYTLQHRLQFASEMRLQQGGEMRAFKSSTHERTRFTVIGEINTILLFQHGNCEDYHFHVENECAPRPQRLLREGFSMLRSFKCHVKGCFDY